MNIDIQTDYFVRLLTNLAFNLFFNLPDQNEGFEQYLKQVFFKDLNLPDKDTMIAAMVAYSNSLTQKKTFSKIYYPSTGKCWRV